MTHFLNLQWRIQWKVQWRVLYGTILIRPLLTSSLFFSMLMLFSSCLSPSSRPSDSSSSLISSTSSSSHLSSLFVNVEESNEEWRHTLSTQPRKRSTLSPLLFPSQPQLSFTPFTPSPSKVHSSKIPQRPKQDLLAEILSPPSLSYTPLGSFPTGSSFCLYPPKYGPTLAQFWNISPFVHWSAPPSSTRSLVLLLYSPDEIDLPWRSTPAGQWINQPSFPTPEGHKIPRQLFFYWVLTHINPQERSMLKWGDGSTQIRIKGKRPGRYPHGISGINSHTQWWRSKPFKGTYGDYDGPCPVMNDPLKIHRIRGILLALKKKISFTHPPSGFQVLHSLRSQTSLILGYSAFEWTFDRSSPLLVSPPQADP